MNVNIYDQIFVWLVWFRFVLDNYTVVSAFTRFHPYLPECLNLHSDTDITVCLPLATEVLRDHDNEMGTKIT